MWSREVPNPLPLDELERRINLLPAEPAIPLRPHGCKHVVQLGGHRPASGAPPVLLRKLAERGRCPNTWTAAVHRKRGGGLGYRCPAARARTPRRQLLYRFPRASPRLPLPGREGLCRRPNPRSPRSPRSRSRGERLTGNDKRVCAKARVARTGGSCHRGRSLAQDESRILGIRP